MRRRVENFLHPRKPPILCLFFLSLSFKKNFSRHPKFHRNFHILALTISCCESVLGAKRFSSNAIQILRRVSHIYNYSVKLTLFLKEGKRSGKRLKNGKKKEMKREKYSLWFESKNKRLFLFCILNYILLYTLS